MVDSDSNKYSYFVFTIQAIKGQTLPGEQTVLKTIKKLTEKYTFQLEKATSLHYQGCCKLRVRKRKNTFINELVAELDVPRSMVVVSPMAGTWEQAKAYCSREEPSLSSTFTTEVTSTGNDIKVLDSEENRFPWQASIINEILDTHTGNIKDSDDRSIIWITDPIGGTGKSKLVKWFCVNNDDIVKISFGTSSQLRSALMAAGPRRVYFVDVPRTLGSDDSIHSLMSAAEDLKNGFVCSSMYGKNQSIVLDPPHIVVFSNKECPQTMMSADRWKMFTINYRKELILMETDIWKES